MVRFSDDNSLMERRSTKLYSSRSLSRSSKPMRLYVFVGRERTVALYLSSSRVYSSFSRKLRTRTTIEERTGFSSFLTVFDYHDPTKWKPSSVHEASVFFLLSLRDYRYNVLRLRILVSSYTTGDIYVKITKANVHTSYEM